MSDRSDSVSEEQENHKGAERDREKGEEAGAPSREAERASHHSAPGTTPEGPGVDSATSHTLPPSRLSRIATGALNAVATAGAATDPLQQTSIKARLRKFMVPIGVLLFLLILFTLFREILLPFILALVIVYLMEPIVSRVGRTEGDPRGIPRWMAVILVYLVFFGVVTTSVILIIPRFVSEIVRFGETVPEEVQTFRTERLPELNQKFQGVLKDYVPPLSPQPVSEIEESPREHAMDVALSAATASKALQTARVQAAKQSTTMYMAKNMVGLASKPLVSMELIGDPGFEEPSYKVSYPKGSVDRARDELMATIQVEGGGWRYKEDSREPSFRMIPVRGGGFDFYLNDVELDIEPSTDKKGWRIRRTDAAVLDGSLKPMLVPSREEHDGKAHTLHAMLDLEQGLDDLVEEVVTSSNARIASLITYAQEFVVGIIQAFVALILTLMVAAFITIDLHAVMNFFRNLIPVEHQASYDELLKEVDRGLSGVVRGQLMICLINGVLTYIGLVILDIKFSLLLAVLAGVLSLIPIFGTILSTLPIVLFGLTDGLMTGVFALLWILGIHFIEANILNPKIIGTSAHIHPVIVIFALLAGESAFGLLGALLAVPTASIFLTLFRFFVMRSSTGQQAIRQMDEELVVHGELVEKKK